MKETLDNEVDKKDKTHRVHKSHTFNLRAIFGDFKKMRSPMFCEASLISISEGLFGQEEDFKGLTKHEVDDILVEVG